MDPVAFLGTYKALPILEDLGMPAITEDTLWQIWKHASGNYWIGPLSPEGSEHADGYTVTSAIVEEGFTKVAGEEAKNEFLCSHDPNLILQWYLQITQGAMAKGSLTPLDEDSTHSIEKTPSEEELIAQLTKYVQEQSDVPATPQVVEEPDLTHQEIPPQAFENIETFDQTLEQALEQALEQESEEPAQTGYEKKHFSYTDLAFFLDEAPAQLGQQDIHEERDVVFQKQPEYVPKEILPVEESERLEELARKQFSFLMQLWDGQPGKYIEAQVQTFLKDPCPYREEAKFLYSDFGVKLRRRGLYNLALICHSHALICSPNDENILFNVARAEYELGNTDATKNYLQKALSISPDFAVAKNFYNFLNAKA